MSKKGPAYERDVCRQLSLWWTEGSRDDIFWRVKGSGGRATTRAKKNLTTINQAGDVFACHPKGLPFTDIFALELKKGYTRFSPFDVMDALWLRKKRTKQEIDKWFAQVKEAQHNTGSLLWMIIFRRNRRQDMVVFPVSFFDFLEQIDARIALKKLNSVTPRMRMVYRPVGNTSIKLVAPEALAIMRLKSFLCAVHPHTIRHLAAQT